MIYRAMGLLHLRLAAVWQCERMTAARRGERGQGTVEYVALILLVAALLAGVVAVSKRSGGPSGIPEAIVRQIRSAIAGLR